MNKYDNMKIIGADETGVGDYLTPLVSAAVYIPAKNIKKLEKLGITDSKKINDKKILKLSEKMSTLIKSSIMYLTQKKYNKLNSYYNAHELKTILHLKAIVDIEKKLKNRVDLIILDRYVNESCFKNYIKKIRKSNPHISEFKAHIKMVTKGEMEHISVAAASIVARAHLLEMIKKQEKKWNMIFPLGTNDNVIKKAKLFVQKNGEKSLIEVAKISFKTTNKIINL